MGKEQIVPFRPRYDFRYHKKSHQKAEHYWYSGAVLFDNAVSVLPAGKATHVEIYDEVAKGLEAKYSSHIIPRRDRQWIFVNAGGWMASFYLMHASVTEYVYFMGTAMHTSGHAGKH